MICRANAEISRVRESLDKEVSLTGAKLQKAELTIKSLTAQVEHKEQEKAGLLEICDELMRKLDGSA